MSAMKRKLKIIRCGLPCINIVDAWELRDGAAVFYDNPKNEAAFQRWLAERRKENAEGKDFEQCCGAAD